MKSNNSPMWNGHLCCAEKIRSTTQSGWAETEFRDWLQWKWTWQHDLACRFRYCFFFHQLL